MPHIIIRKIKARKIPKSVPQPGECTAFPEHRSKRDSTPGQAAGLQEGQDFRAGSWQPNLVGTLLSLNL